MAEPPSLTLQPDMLLRPVRRLLRPLVRLLIKRGVTFPALADVLRSLYVEVAAHELLTEPRARTDSRISLLTGVHRKEIRRWRSETHEPGASTRRPRRQRMRCSWFRRRGAQPHRRG